MKKTFLLLLPVLLGFLSVKQSGAQTREKLPVFGEVGLGFGQTLLFGNIRQQFIRSLGGSFQPGIGNNLMMGFYLAPAKWQGLGIGSRIKGTFGTSVAGETDTDEYIFNFYNLSLSAKYYPFSRTYNQGFYARGSLGFGQFTAKRLNETTRQYVHQYGIGSTQMLGIGYSIPLKKTSLSLEAEFEHSGRNGTVSGVGDGVVFRSGQLGLNAYVTF